jgi:Flp pilus assembly protein TadG
MDTCKMNRATQTGATMTEFIIAMPVFILLVFVIAELSLMYQAKSVLDMAALSAARAGAINHASLSAMKSAAAVALTPLYTHGTGRADLLKGGAKSQIDTRLPAIYGKGWSDMPGHGMGIQQVVRIEILSPTREMANGLGVTRNGVRVIPNDNLTYRRTDVLAAGVNIQDANLLKIKVTYLYQPRMPLTQYFFAPFVDANLTRTLFTDRFPHGRTSPDTLERDDPRYARVPLVAYATVRMQSDAQVDNLPDGTGSAGRSGGSGSAGGGSSTGGGSGSSSGGNGGGGLGSFDSSGSSDGGSAGGRASDADATDVSGDPEPSCGT